MLYYKVKPTADQIRIRKIKKHHFLIANELYTPCEINKHIQSGLMDNSFVRNHFTREEISKKKTYLLSGARFKSKN